jgi:hypothetical protein
MRSRSQVWLFLMLSLRLPSPPARTGNAQLSGLKLAAHPLKKGNKLRHNWPILAIGGDELHEDAPLASHSREQS